MKLSLPLVLWLSAGSMASADPRKPAPPFMDRARWFQKFSEQQKSITTGRHRVCFLNKKWKPGLTRDGTHLTAKGYDVLAGPIAKRLAKFLGDSSR